MKTQIKNIIAVLALSIGFFSCTTTSFSTVYNIPTTAKDYTDQKWLFTSADVPADLQPEFDQQVVSFLESCYGNNFVNYKTNKNQYFFPSVLYEVNRDVFIDQLHKSNEIRFYLHLNAEVVRFDIGAELDVNPEIEIPTKTHEETRIRVTFEVVDLVKRESVYSQSVEGFTQKEGAHKEDAPLILPLDNQFRKAFAKAFKKFKKDFSCN